ncbi:sigma-70 family RNA polymerase sigma factor [Williamsia sp. 1135]|uniref:sigma-70 family RNA polymerase sigma factor n=1 Tax=Williamsia sp. 1135 TaxID=1889262 RepID=UPI000A1105FF|nr:sigma-70 family RNA polymerase sigma factor [Williamsia sp. 1135]ORM26823.1 RNA polymerase subunit sigma-70 [Williamsia sp. 1135]
MTPDMNLAGAFEDERGRLTTVAQRILGSRADAEDAVQETWFRLARQDHESLTNVPGWLTTVVGRVCIDMLRSRQSRPSPLYDDYLLDALVTDDDAPEDNAMLAESVGLALLVVLGSLKPEERLAFVLHDMFAVPFAEIGEIIGRSTNATKMLASRARQKVKGADHPTGRRRQQREVVDAFLVAARGGDFDALVKLLDPDVTWRTRTPRGVVTKQGAAAVIGAISDGLRADVVAQRVLVNGEPGILVWGPKGKPVSVMACNVVDGRLADVVALLDPTRLAAMDLPEPPPRA